MSARMRVVVVSPLPATSAPRSCCCLDRCYTGLTSRILEVPIATHRRWPAGCASSIVRLHIRLFVCPPPRSPACSPTAKPCTPSRRTRQAYKPLTTVIYYNFIILILYDVTAKPISQGNATRSYRGITLLKGTNPPGN